MRFDELDLEEAVLDGLDAMNFLETTPVQELTNSGHFRRERHYCLCTDRDRKDCGLCVAGDQ